MDKKKQFFVSSVTKCNWSEYRIYGTI